METINNLVSYKNKFEKFIIIIRHSNREKIPDGVHDIITPINEIGQKNAQKIGNLLQSFNIVKIYSSPVERCIETSKNILKGYKKEIPIEISEMLGEPGPYVHNKNVAKNNFINFTTKIVVEKQIANEKLEGIRNIKKGSELFKKFIFSNLKNLNEKEIIIMISHDAIIAPFIYYFIGEKFGKNNWINFLDGIILAQSNNHTYAIRKKIYEIN